MSTPANSNGLVGSIGMIDSNHASADESARWFDLARRGDRAAFGRLVSLLQDRLYNAVYRLVGHPDDAMEVTQEAFTKALQNITECRGQSQAYTWIFRIAMNVAISRHRSGRVRRAISLDAPRPGESNGSGDQMSTLRDRIASTSLGPAQTAEKKERLGLVMQALNQLADDDRSLLVMRDIDGMDYNEMAEVLEIPLGTLKSRLFRARMALRARLEALER